MKALTKMMIAVLLLLCISVFMIACDTGLVNPDEETKDAGITETERGSETESESQSESESGSESESESESESQTEQGTGMSDKGHFDATGGYGPIIRV